MPGDGGEAGAGAQNSAGGSGAMAGSSGAMTGGGGASAGAAGAASGTSGGTAGGAVGATGGTTNGAAGTTVNAGTSGSAGTSTGGSGSELCSGVDCSGHGVCDAASGAPICTCDAGYVQSPSDATACVDVDECAVANGGCDSLTTCSNVPGTRTCGACPPAYDGDGASGCVPHGCNGAPDPSCACIKVAPGGDDALAVTSGGASPFQGVQAAVDFAAAHRAHATSVCVAEGAVCGSSATYGAVTLRDGISVYGNYEATGWTRCPASWGATLTAVSFGPDIASPTILDDFAIATAPVSIT